MEEKPATNFNPPPIPSMDYQAMYRIRCQGAPGSGTTDRHLDCIVWPSHLPLLSVECIGGSTAWLKKFWLRLWLSKF